MERNFKDVVENIRGAEKDVDKVLNAARLERHEGPNPAYDRGAEIDPAAVPDRRRNVSDPAARPHTVIEGGPHGKQILP